MLHFQGFVLVVSSLAPCVAEPGSSYCPFHRVCPRFGFHNVRNIACFCIRVSFAVDFWERFEGLDVTKRVDAVSKFHGLN